MSGSPAPSSAPVPDAELVAELRAAGCVFAEDEAALLVGAAAGPAELAAMVARRVAGLPLEQVIGWAEFCGLRILVEPGVFVPRRRTELLVRSAAETITAATTTTTTGPATPVVVDLCCGSGAIGAALAALVGRVELYAVDVDPAAVRCARRNVAAYGGHVLEGDLFEPLPAALRGRVDVLVANAPYVPTDEIPFMPAEARLHEPQVALDGGADGLDLQRRVIAAASRWLAPGGHLLIETSERQAPHTLEAFVRSGLEARVLSSDELDATVVVGTPAQAPTGTTPSGPPGGPPPDPAGPPRTGTGARHVLLVELPATTIHALARGDLGAANRAAPLPLTPYFVDGDDGEVWRMRSEQITADPGVQPWITRAIWDVDARVTVGRAGYHGPPDGAGMVEVGYAIDPALRRRGYARAALVALLDRAASEPTVRTVRACIRPDNLASRGLAQQYGFVEVGEQWDDVDGLETVFEVDATASGPGHLAR